MTYQTAVPLVARRSADINLADNEGNTALHEAARNDAADAVQLLISAGANAAQLNEELYAPLHVAAQLEKLLALEAMAKFAGRLDAGIKGKHGRTPLHVAAIHDHPKAVQTLVSSRRSGLVDRSSVSV